MPACPYARSTDRVIEIGCGTGRNLALLARKHSTARFFGVDAANVMIETARTKIARQNLSGRVHLRAGPCRTVSIPWLVLYVPFFDSLFFSYSLSMIPTWAAAIDAALANLKLGGELWVVDFWDQAGYPWPMPTILRKWLGLFHVHHRPELLAYLSQLQADGRGILTVESHRRQRYGYLARFVKNAETRNEPCAPRTNMMAASFLPSRNQSLLDLTLLPERLGRNK